MGHRQMIAYSLFALGVVGTALSGAFPDSARMGVSNCYSLEKEFGFIEDDFLVVAHIVFVVIMCLVYSLVQFRPIGVVIVYCSCLHSSYEGCVPYGQCS